MKKNKALYEKIMLNVSREVKRTLNEALYQKNIIKETNVLEGISELFEQVQIILTELYNAFDNINPQVPSIIITLKSDFNDTFYKLIDNDCRGIFSKSIDYLGLGYSFTTESNMVTIVLHMNTMSAELLYKILLKIMSEAAYNTQEDIKYSIYFGFFRADEKDPVIDYLFNALKQKFRNCYSMDDEYLLFTELNSLNSYDIVKDIATNIPEE